MKAYCLGELDRARQSRARSRRVGEEIEAKIPQLRSFGALERSVTSVATNATKSSTLHRARNFFNEYGVRYETRIYFFFTKQCINTGHVLVVLRQSISKTSNKFLAFSDLLTYKVQKLLCQFPEPEGSACDRRLRWRALYILCTRGDDSPMRSAYEVR